MALDSIDAMGDSLETASPPSAIAQTLTAADIAAIVQAMKQAGFALKSDLALTFTVTKTGETNTSGT